MVSAVLATLFVAGFLAVVGAFIFAFIRKNSRPYSVRMAILAVVLTFVLATFGVIVAGRMFYFHRLSAASSPTATRVIYTSQTYDLQSGLFTLEGSVRGLSRGQQLWVVFRDSRSDRLFPAKAPCATLPGDRFSCSRIATGAPTSTRPNVKGFIVAVAPGASAAVLRLDVSGLSLEKGNVHRLPDGVTLIGKVTIGN
jgi:hypothetical protein